MTNTVFSSFSLSNRALNVLYRAKFSSVDDLVQYVASGHSLKDLKGCGAKSVMELEQLLADCQADVSPKPIMRETPIADLYRSLNAAAKAYLERYYVGARMEALSIRSQNMLRPYAKSFSEFVGFMDYTPSELAVALSVNPRLKFVCELVDLKAAMNSELNHVATLTRGEIRQLVLSERFNFLDKDEVAMVAEFEASNGFLPCFFLTLKYMERPKWSALKDSDKRHLAIYRDYLALDGDKNAVGELYGITDERVRQIVVECSKLREFVKKLDWEAYDLDGEDVLTEQSPIFESVRSKECHGMSFLEFCGIAQLASCLDAERVAGKWFLIDNNVIGADCVRNAVATLRYKLDKQYGHDTIESVESYIESESIDPRMVDVVSAVFACFATVVGNSVIFPKNHIDVGEEVRDILRHNGASMHIDDVYTLLVHKYPNLKYDSAEKLRNYLNSLAEVCMSASKNGMVCLPEGTDSYYSGSIRQRVVDVLEQAGRPMTSEEITSRVKVLFPNTNWSSIASSLALDPHHSLMRTADGRYKLVA